jgi:endogenous inhibitor of DNA gyrase (YacG/DUF329 family)
VRALRAEFVRKPRTKRFCSERCQRIAERRRYRERHTEKAICPNCERVFERTATSMRKAIFCSPSCMAEHRSASYAKRPDIQAGIRRAREAKGTPREPRATRAARRLRTLLPATVQPLARTSPI